MLLVKYILAAEGTEAAGVLEKPKIQKNRPKMVKNTHESRREHRKIQRFITRDLGDFTAAKTGKSTKVL